MRSATRRHVGKDKAYLAFIHTLPCCVCVTMRVRQTSPTEAAHVGPRAYSTKCPDRETAPLCREHHREGQFCQHALGKRFWGHYDLDREELLGMYQAMYDAGGVLNPFEVVCL